MSSSEAAGQTTSSSAPDACSSHMTGGPAERLSTACGVKMRVLPMP
jgi:hypothetical protein